VYTSRQQICQWKGKPGSKVTTISHHYRKDVWRPHRFTIRLAVVISGMGLTRQESHLIAEKEVQTMKGYQYTGYEMWP
jgi:hypothetical protein